MDQAHSWASSDPAIFCIFLLIVFLIHFLPSFIAFSRNHPSRVLILVLNVLLGWTVIGWIILTVWAAKGGEGTA